MADFAVAGNRFRYRNRVDLGSIEGLPRGHVDVRQESFNPGSMALDAATLDSEPGRPAPWSGSRIPTEFSGKMGSGRGAAWAFVTNLLTAFADLRILSPLY